MESTEETNYDVGNGEGRKEHIYGIVTSELCESYELGINKL